MPYIPEKYQCLKDFDIYQIYEKESSMPKPSSWRIKKAVLEFKLRLLKQQGENVLKIVLFGSVARNDHKAGSDIDLFVLLKEKGVEEKNAVMDIASQLNCEKMHNGIYISPFIVSKTDYDEDRTKSLVFYNIRDEGMVLYESEEQ